MWKGREDADELLCGYIEKHPSRLLVTRPTVACIDGVLLGGDRRGFNERAVGGPISWLIRSQVRARHAHGPQGVERWPRVRSSLLGGSWGRASRVDRWQRGGIFYAALSYIDPPKNLEEVALNRQALSDFESGMPPSCLSTMPVANLAEFGISGQGQFRGGMTPRVGPFAALEGEDMSDGQT